jgi:hypothetical protein
MNVPNHAAQERRTAVLLAIQDLKEAFPLQQKLEQADTSLQQAYAGALTHWIRHGVPPAKEYAPAPLLAALHEIDAIVVDEHGIGCYPFSARHTGIQLNYAGMLVHEPPRKSRRLQFLREWSHHEEETTTIFT